MRNLIEKEVTKVFDMEANVRDVVDEIMKITSNNIDSFIKSDLQVLVDGMEKSNKLIKNILEWTTNEELGDYVSTNLKNAYWRNETALNNYLNIDAKLTKF